MLSYPNHFFSYLFRMCVFVNNLGFLLLLKLGADPVGWANLLNEIYKKIEIEYLIETEPGLKTWI